MECKRTYVHMQDGGLVHYTCKTLRARLADLSCEEMINPKHIKEIREKLLQCPTCNQSRIDMLEELKPENAKALLEPYKHLKRS